MNVIPTSVPVRFPGVHAWIRKLTAAKILEMKQQRSANIDGKIAFFSTHAPFLLRPSFFSMKLLSWGSSPVFGSKSTFFLIQGSLIATIIYWSILISKRPIGFFGSQHTTRSSPTVCKSIYCSRLWSVMMKKNKKMQKKLFLFPRPLLYPSAPPVMPATSTAESRTVECTLPLLLVESCRALLQSKMTRNQGTNPDVWPWK